MGRRFFAIAAFALSGTDAYALCHDGPPFACTIHGQPGTRECANGHITPCIPDDPTPPPRHPTASGIASPNYLVMTVIYAPPGTQGGRASSSVSYGSGSNTGTTTSTSRSFKAGFTLTAKATGGFIGTGASVGVSFGVSGSSTDGTSLEIKKTVTTTIKDDGPGTDGIDHDHDLIYLWLNPQIALTVTSNTVAWTFTGANQADIQFVYVGWLKNPSTMPPGVAQALARNGVTAADYPAILARDPFANGLSGPPGPRFVSLNTTFPYEPPFSAADSVPTTTFNLTTSTTNTATGMVSDDYKVGLSLTASAGAAPLLSVALTSDSTWEWTNTSSHSSAGGTTETASVTVGGPAFGYTGPTDIQVFYDTIYKTFLFAPVDSGTPVAFHGRLTAGNEVPLAFHEVTAVSGGRRFRTFTNASGEYKIFGAVGNDVRLQSGRVVKRIDHIRPGAGIDLRLR